jgi:hypothetical protein
MDVKIELVIDDVTIKLTAEKAKELQNLLNNILGRDTHIPWFPEVSPAKPYWEFYTTCDGTSVIKEK